MGQWWTHCKLLVWEWNLTLCGFSNPATNDVIAKVRTGTVEDYEHAIQASRAAYEQWSDLPAPARGEIVRQIGDALRSQIQNLGKLVCVAHNQPLGHGFHS